MSQNPQIEAKAYRAFHEELSRHIVHGDDAYQAAIRAYLASQEAVAPSEEPHSDFAVARDAVWRSLETVRQAALASPAVAPVAQSEPADLIERLRGPVFGTQTALDAATAIETWKARAERLADMHRDMCVVAGEAVARAETAEAALSTAPSGDGVPGQQDNKREAALVAELAMVKKALKVAYASMEGDTCGHFHRIALAEASRAISQDGEER